MPRLFTHNAKFAFIGDLDCALGNSYGLLDNFGTSSRSIASILLGGLFQNYIPLTSGDGGGN